MAKALQLVVSLFALSFSVAAVAKPALNDYAFFTGTVKMQGRRLAVTAELQIVNFDSAKNTYLQRAVNAYAGQVDTNEEWLAPESILTIDDAMAVVSDCAGQGGTLETLDVPAGTFNACRIQTDDKESTSTVWVAPVPWGIVKSHSVAKDGSMESDLELENYQAGH